MTYNKQWLKAAKPTPSKEAFALAEQFAREGTKTAFALAMHFRPQGATHKEVIEAVGSPQAVKRSELVEAGQVQETRAKRDGKISYKLALPAKASTRAASKATSKRKASTCNGT